MDHTQFKGLFYPFINFKSQFNCLITLKIFFFQFIAINDNIHDCIRSFFFFFFETKAIDIFFLIYAEYVF